MIMQYMNVYEVLAPKALNHILIKRGFERIGHDMNLASNILNRSW